jgi:hypothetical protein
MGMRVKQTILGLFWLLLLISTAAAYDLTPSTISSSVPGWLIANDGTDQAIITVIAKDAGSPPTPVANANVSFYLDPTTSDFGTLTPQIPVTVQTGLDGKATAIFKTSKKSGTAIINATISVYDGGVTTPVEVSTIQRVDHDTPQYASFNHPASLPVGSITQASVTLTDRWGNLIDNKNVAETIRLTMADEGGAGLWNGVNYTTQQTYSTNGLGKVIADLRISTSIRSNYIQMDPIGNIKIPQGSYIQGVSESEPWFIEQTPASPGSLLPADGDPANAVEIYYTVFDKFNNPITGATVNFYSTDGLSLTAPTNTWGKVRISFGPKDTVGNYKLTASTPGNASVVCKNDGFVGSCNQTVEYYNTDPVDMTFTANPQSMTSLDVNPSTRSLLQARVIDIKGNPVIGQTVHFSLAAPTYPGGPYVETTAPALSATSADVGGAGNYATVQFSPGAFSTSGAGYNATATGQVIATATWTWTNKDGDTITKTRDVTLVWKNYPYISTSSLGDCGNSQVGDKVNITIQLYGDGAALRPKPIDAELVIDRSGSMNEAMDSHTKLYWAKEAATTFVNKMNPGADKVGLVSYGGDYATVDSSLNTDFGAVITAINAISQGGYTPTRLALKTAIEDVDAHRNSNLQSIQAIVLMSDGEYNYYGDPLARGTGYNPTYKWTGTSTSAHTWFSGLGGVVGVDNANKFTQQNQSIYAGDKNIRVYTVSFGSGITESSDTWKTMEILSNSTGGQHFHASTGAELVDIYTTIAGALQETAGGDTEVALDFGTMMINDEDLGIENYMNYTYVPGLSTLLNKSHLSKDNVYTQQVFETRNDETAWLDDRKLSFDVGTIKLNETWRATFQMNLTQAGKIDLFGPGSSGISFTDASTGTTQTGFIPAMQCRVRESIVNTGFGTKMLFVDNLTYVAGASPDPDIWALTWNTTYDGDKTVQTAVLYRVAGDPVWKTVPGALFFNTGQKFEEETPYTLSTSDTSLWPLGKTFEIQIVAGAEDANAARSNVITISKDPSVDTVYIRLE